MGFNAANLTRVTPLNVTGPAVYQYNTNVDAIATVGGSTYFTPFAHSSLQTLLPYPFSVDDVINCTCTDGTIDLIVTAINPIATAQQTVTFVVGPNSVNTAAIQDGAVTPVKIAADAVTTVKILAANVTLAKLAAGITPSHIIKFAGQLTTVGGAAAEAFAVAGAAAATDRAFVQIVNDGTNNRTALQAVVTNNVLTVTFSGDPGNDLVFNYQLIRAAS